MSDKSKLPSDVGQVKVRYALKARPPVVSERISNHAAICLGQACVKGTRIPVDQIVRMIAKGDTVEDLLAEYPSLTREDIDGCLQYAS